MPFQKLQFKPGVNRDQTNYTNEGGWYECDKIRFRSGMPEKIGGWLLATPEYMLGVCRQLFGWITSYNDNLLACGTNKKAYIEVGGYYYDITPLREADPTFTTPDTDNCFTTTNGSSVVTVTITGCAAEEGNFVDFTGTNAIGTITATLLNTTHEIQTVINADAFTIDVGTAANTTGSGGGTTINASFEIDTGYPIATLGYGWGTGTWGGSQGWGLAGSTPVDLPQQDWWFDQFSNDLVMNVRNGAIYYWQRGTDPTPGVALATRATLLSSTTIDGVAPADVPDAAMQVLVSQNDKHLLAFGCQPYAGAAGDFDPLLIRWATQDQPNIWTPLQTNSAGFLRVSRGSKILRAIATRQEILVFTESTLNSLQFTGTTDVFSLQEIGDNLSFIGPRCATVVNNMTFWMGHDKFYVYSGRVETLPCTLRDHVFNNINFDQSDQVICGTNEGWNEVWWMYPTADSNYNNAYVIYNHLERIWYYGSIERSAWLDSPLREFPQAVYANTSTEISYLYNHEYGTNDGTLPMTAYIQSSDFDLMDGDQFMLTRRMIPDINFAGSTAANPEATFSIKPRNFPGAAYQTNASNAQRVIQTTVNQFTNEVFMRARARQVGIKVQSTGLDTQWQLGSPRLDMRPDGKR
jgi:hypothetical protein